MEIQLRFITTIPGAYELTVAARLSSSPANKKCLTFNNKTIFIISYENWGKMLMSKHHYAVELARMGNRVFFINHPDRRNEMPRGEVKIEPTEYEGLSVVKHRLIHPYFLKFKFKRLYNMLTSMHIRKIVKRVGAEPDIVWSFDAGNTLPLKFFPHSERRIYMPVDGPFWHKEELLAAEKADIILSVTPEILSRYKGLGKPLMQINHGVASAFLQNGSIGKPQHPIRVGYSGSLVRNDLDIPVFLEIIASNPQIQFEFWGEHDFRKSSIHLPQDVSEKTKAFLETLKSWPNVKMHGPVHSDVLARGIAKMDVLLICYNIKNDQNHHKVLEYLGTGKVIVSNYLSAYGRDYPGLIEMVTSPENNRELPALFSNVINNLSFYNSPDLYEKRKNFAAMNSYTSNIMKIEAELNRVLS